MSSKVALILAVLVVVVVWAADQWRRREARKFLKLKLAVAGFDTSGKTVFLSSMFDKLRVPGGDGIFLETSPEVTGKLQAIYRQTADTAADFPPPTNPSKVTEWPFTVKAKSATGIVDVARFTYLDFAGESLREAYRAPNPETDKLLARFKEADILMAALDGLHVKRYLEGNPFDGFYQDLGTLLALLSGHTKPVNLILTKWDILHDHYTFRQVVEGLLRIEQFADFVRAQRAFGITGVLRLIPVSSVGYGFAVEAGDRMHKVPGGTMNPFRVEMPIACALPGAAIVAAHQTMTGPAGADRLLGWARTMSVAIGPVVLGAPFSAEPVMGVSATTPTAVSQLVKYCASSLVRLNAEFPESDLVGFQLRQEM